MANDLTLLYCRLTYSTTEVSNKPLIYYDIYRESILFDMYETKCTCQQPLSIKSYYVEKFRIQLVQFLNNNHIWILTIRELYGSYWDFSDDVRILTRTALFTFWCWKLLSYTFKTFILDDIHPGCRTHRNTIINTKFYYSLQTGVSWF